jgi:hypothetical protein
VAARISWDEETVSYNVATNATSMILTGSMTVAGETYTVIQSGAKPPKP